MGSGLGFYVSLYFINFSPELDYLLTSPVVRDTAICLRASSCTFFLLLGLKEMLALPRSSEASSCSWSLFYCLSAVHVHPGYVICLPGEDGAASPEALGSLQPFKLHGLNLHEIAFFH